ncbi:hypothetical protein BMS3Abin14_01489 [bacterium BMS3Abin14]|nr:hypothetical protein BMS3Abin14_01489 [bacterium BMS3Abin14]
MNRWARAVLCVAFLLLTVVPVSAHKVNIYAYEEGGKIHTESYFVDGTPARDSQVTAYDGKGKVVAEGRTDDEGVFVFPVEHPENLRIVLEASMGHRNEILLSAADTVSSEAGSMSQQGNNPPGVKSGSLYSAPDGSRDTSLNRAVERALDRRLGSMNESILKIERAMEKPSLSKVLGGLGYIIGLAGAFLWGLSRKRS